MEIRYARNTTTTILTIATLRTEGQLMLEQRRMNAEHHLVTLIAKMRDYLKTNQ